jgi:hypothetical protein
LLTITRRVGDRLAVGHGDEAVTLIDVDTGRTVVLWDSVGYGVTTAVRWSPDGTSLVALQTQQGGGHLGLAGFGADGSLVGSTLLEPDVDEGLADGIGSIRYSHDGRSVYCSVHTGEGISVLACHDVDSGALRWQHWLDLSLAGGWVDVEELYGVLAVSQDSRLVVRGDNGGELLVLDAGSGRLVQRAPLLASHPLAWSAASPTGAPLWVAVDALPQRYPLPRQW